MVLSQAPRYCDPPFFPYSDGVAHGIGGDCIHFLLSVSSSAVRVIFISIFGRGAYLLLFTICSDVIYNDISLIIIFQCSIGVSITNILILKNLNLPNARKFENIKTITLYYFILNIDRIVFNYL